MAFMKKNRVTWVAVGVLIVVAALAYLVTNWRTPGPAVAGVKGEARAGATADGAAKATPGGPPPTPVEVIVVKPATVQEDLQAVGSLRSNESVILRPEVAGRIATIGFRDGQVVKKGQLLIGLDASLNEAEVAQYKAEYDLALSNLKRSEDLARQKFISSSAQETAASNAQVAEARLKLAQARLSKMRLIAPFDGIVGIRGVSLGDYVKDGTDLVNIEDVRNLKVDFRLPERSLTQIRVGQGIDVVADALPNERWPGTIEAVNPRIDASGRSLELRARLDNSGGKLRPGMFARVRVIIGERANALLVPEEAIVPQGEEFFVYKVVEGAAKRVPVKLGVRRDARVEILQGIEPGDRVVTAGMRLSRDGQPVRVLSADEAAKGDAAKGEAKSGGPAPAKAAGKA
jgi:membrane fusion protein (multidrug efflux system)